MAKHMLHGVVNYINDTPGTSLERVDVVIFQPEMVQEFVGSMKSAIDKKDPWWKRIGAMVSEFVTYALTGEAPGKIQLS